MLKRPLDLVLMGNENRWKLIKCNTKIPRDLFLDCIKFIMESTYFIDNKYYRQIFDHSDGFSNLLNISQYCFTRSTEEGSSENVFKIPVYFRCVDDTILFISKNKLNLIIDTFNSFNDRLQFTVEKETNGSIPFYGL